MKTKNTIGLKQVNSLKTLLADLSAASDAYRATLVPRELPARDSEGCRRPNHIARSEMLPTS